MTEETEVLARINNLVDRIERSINELWRAIDSGINWLPPGLRDAVRRGWDQLVSVANDLWNSVATVLSNMGSPGTLKQTATAWSDHVGGPVSAQVQSATAGALRTDDSWVGAAADSYRQTLPLQSTALDKVRSALTDGMSTALSDAATKIEQFWGVVIAAMVTLLAGIFSAILSSATIFGLPAAPFLAGTALVVAAGSIFIGSRILESSLSTADAALRQKLDDNSGFRNGHWPEAVVG